VRNLLLAPKAIQSDILQHLPNSSTAGSTQGNLWKIIARDAIYVHLGRESREKP
jgi:hypothetical protein